MSRSQACARPRRRGRSKAPPALAVLLLGACCLGLGQWVRSIQPGFAPAGLRPDRAACRAHAGAAASPTRGGVRRAATLTEDVERRSARSGQVEPGDAIDGKVTQIAGDFAFVDFGGVTDGRIHVSALRPEFTEKVSDVVSVGDKVQGFVLKKKSTYVELTLKHDLSDRTKLSALEVGATVGGEVIDWNPRIGTFMDIGAVVDVLVPIKDFAGANRVQQLDAMKQSLPKGGTVMVKIRQVDLEAGRVTVGLADAS